MSDIDTTLDTLRDAAEAGDAAAAAELGRLLCLLPTLEDGDSADDRWPGELWLRIALAANPNDAVSTVLLASRLVQQIAAMLGGEESYDSDTVEEAVSRRRIEATALYDRAFAADATKAAAEAGIALLDEVVEGEQSEPTALGYSYHLVENDAGIGSAEHLQQLVVTDAEELRWACGRWFEWYGSLTGFTLASFVEGERIGIVDLGAVRLDADDRLDWSAVEIPALPGEPLPVGHPVGPVHYGYTALAVT